MRRRRGTFRQRQSTLPGRDRVAAAAEQGGELALRDAGLEAVLTDLVGEARPVSPRSLGVLNQHASTIVLPGNHCRGVEVRKLCMSVEKGFDYRYAQRSSPCGRPPPYAGRYSCAIMVAWMLERNASRLA